MSEADVSMIQDEDLLRRMWQQTEDFSKKKEIRTHMYRLREERLRNLYSPEPGFEGKGRLSHANALMDESFQSLKSKEVRDAGSPVLERRRCPQELNELSNAGWNVESQSKTTDAGHTQVKSIQASIEGTYDVEGGKGQFAAVDQQMQAGTEYVDGNTSFKSNKTATETASRDHVVRQANDGTHISSTTQTSSSSSKTQKVLSSKYESVPYENNSIKIDNETNGHRGNLINTGELIARKVEYPDNNTKVTVETRCLPDGTRVTSTRREIRESSAVSSKNEKHSEHTEQTFASSRQSESLSNKLSSTTTRKNTENSSDSFKKESQEHQTKSESKSADETTSTSSIHKKTEENFQNETILLSQLDREFNLKDDYHNSNHVERVGSDRKNDDKRTKKEDFHEQKSTTDYKTTYQNDFTNSKISSDLSPTHQAWASTLRGDTPSRPSARGTSPTKSYGTASPRDSVSPDKYRKPFSRGGSPNKIDRSSTASTFINSNNSNRETRSSNRTSIDRYSKSPEKKTYSISRQPDSPDRESVVSSDTVTITTETNKSTKLEQEFLNEESDTNIPGYMRPTASSLPKEVPSRRSPTKSPERKYHCKDVEEDYDKLVTEESEIYKNTKLNNRSDSKYQTYRKSPSPVRKSPDGDVTDNARNIAPLIPSLKKSRSPSPPKGPVTFTDDIYKTHSKTEVDNVMEKNKTKHINIHSTTNETKSYTKEMSQKEVKTKETSLDKNMRHVSPSKKTYTNTYNDNVDFIESERKSDEINKRNGKSRPRQLVTPSSSPTRKPFKDDTVLSGQSSPTTSVSEIIYINSPTETNTYHLSDHRNNNSKDFTPISQRPDSLDIKRSPSPTKIPCRSPSPDKKTLPRKSSLKKVSSPGEKPPLNFCISPSTEENSAPKQNIIKKDDGKVKPPLERRETYEERCRKILGMMSDDKSSHKKSVENSTADFIAQEKNDNIIVYKNEPDISKVQENNPSPTKLKDITNETTEISEINTSDFVSSEYQTTKNVRASASPERKMKQPKSFDAESRSEIKHSRTPSPSKSSKKSIDTDEIGLTESEREILEKVQKSLRKLSPKRDSHRSPSQERNTGLMKTSLQDIDIVATKKVEESTKTTSNMEVEKKEILSKGHQTDNTIKTNSSIPTKFVSGNKSPLKKQPSVPKSEKAQVSPTKMRCQSPKKLTMTIERPASPQAPKIMGSKLKEPFSKKLSSGSIPTTKTEKLTSPSIEIKKTVTNKQKNNNIIITSKVSSTKMTQVANKTTGTDKEMTTTTTKGKENLTPKREDTKFSRTTSENLIKNKKSSPQRVKSKPEIQVTEVTQITNHKSKTDKSKMNLSHKDQTRISIKPKSATDLNTPSDDHDIIVDVEQAKSSRENSPDRICPTPIGFLDDVGTPRYPDEVNEPDDEFQRRTHNIIHETETSVDDIIEISEEEDSDENLNVKHISESKECLLNSSNEVSIKQIRNPDEISSEFNDIEKIVHSDFTDEKYDECLLSVSQKVNKFAKGVQEPKNLYRPNISEEYDVKTSYQDELTKKSVNDKASFFVEAADNITAHSLKPNRKPILRPNLDDIDDSIQNDDCLLSVSDKVNKFIKTAEEFLNETKDSEKKERFIQKEFNIDTIYAKDHKDINEKANYDVKQEPFKSDHIGSFAKETTSSHAKNKDFSSPNLKPDIKTSGVQVATLRSSEAVKKAKALFENIASSNETTSTKLVDIGVIKKSSKTDSTTALHPSLEKIPTEVPDTTKALHKSRPTSANSQRSEVSPHRLRSTSSDGPLRSNKDNISHTVLSRYPVADRPESPKKDLPHYQKSTKTSQLKEEPKIEESEVSSRRGSGKFGVELRRTSIEKTNISTTTERKKSVEHPCIEDIYDVQLLEQMLEKVVGYEQRRRIRAQIRIAKKKMELNLSAKTQKTKSPDRVRKVVPNAQNAAEPDSKLTNGSDKEVLEKRQRPKSPEKCKPRSPMRQPSPEKKTRTQSPSKVASTKPKPNRFNEYASAYMKKVGLNEKEIQTEKKRHVELETDTNKSKSNETYKTKVQNDLNTSKESHSTETRHETKTTLSEKATKTNTSKSSIKRTPSPEKMDRVYHRSPSPDFKRRTQNDFASTLVDINKVTSTKSVSESKPSWVTSRNLKTVTSETRNYTKKTDDKKYRAVSPSKVISKPIDVITSSYGIGPLGADGKPLFGIKALRNGATNYQVRGTVIRQEYHSKDGGPPEGSVSVTAYSNQPEELEALLKKSSTPPSRIHGLAAITTTTKFGGDTGTTLQQAHSKEEHAALEQFTHSDRKATNTRIEEITDFEDNHSENTSKTESIESKQSKNTEKHTQETRKEIDNRRSSIEKRMEREDRKTVRQSSVKSLTEKFIKNACDTSKSERVPYPKAGLILRTNSKENAFSNQGFTRAGSEHSVNSDENERTETRTTNTHKDLGNGYQQTKTVTTTKTAKYHDAPVNVGQVTKSQETVTRQTFSTNAKRVTGQTGKSFLDNGTKVTGVQDILTRMRNADIVIEDGDTCEEAEARALLNKFLGATVLMAGMQGYVADKESLSAGRAAITRETKELDIDQCWDEQLLNKLLSECTDYEQRRRLRARLRTLMAEQEACAAAVTEALAGEEKNESQQNEKSEKEEVTTVTSSVRRNSSEKTSSSSTTTKTSKVTESSTRSTPKNVSPFAKFRQLEKQNSTNTPKM